MNKITIAAALMSFSTLALSNVVPAPVDHLFVPKGFDNNDNVELVVTGKFPSPCYTLNKVEVKVQDDVVKVTVTSLHKEKLRNSLCAPMKVPFSEVVKIGSLQAGDYKVLVNDKLQEELVVETAGSQSVDDHLYASVDYVDLGFTGGLGGDAMLVGRTISSCLELDHVEYISNGKDTFSILPIMKKVSDVCPEENKRLEIPVRFDLRSLKNDNVLLFVRSVEGKSIHTLISKE